MYSDANLTSTLQTSYRIIPTGLCQYFVPGRPKSNFCMMRAISNDEWEIVELRSTCVKELLVRHRFLDFCRMRNRIHFGFWTP